MSYGNEDLTSAYYIQTVERVLLREALQAILHTILFHRVFANIKPKDMDILDLTIVSMWTPKPVAGYA